MSARTTNTQTKVLQGATDTVTITPANTGYAVILVGATTSSFGGGSVAVSVGGVPVTGLTAVTSATHALISVIGGLPVVATLSSGTSSSITVVLSEFDLRRSHE